MRGDRARWKICQEIHGDVFTLGCRVFHMWTQAILATCAFVSHECLAVVVEYRRVHLSRYLIMTRICFDGTFCMRTKRSLLATEHRGSVLQEIMSLLSEESALEILKHDICMAGQEHSAKQWHAKRQNRLWSHCLQCTIHKHHDWCLF